MNRLEINSLNFVNGNSKMANSNKRTKCNQVSQKIIGLAAGMDWVYSGERGR
jgi:hypothetical protein